VTAEVSGGWEPSLVERARDFTVETWRQYQWSVAL
jgi:hypothetical protein